MKIELTSLFTNSFSLKRPVDGTDKHNVVELERSGGLSGAYINGEDAHKLDKLTAEALRVVSFQWHLSNGVISAAAGTLLEAASIDLSIPKTDDPMSLTLQMESATFPGLSIGLESVQVRGKVALTGLAVQLAPNGDLAVAAVGAKLTNVTLGTGSTQVTADELSVGGLKVKRTSTDLRVETASLSGKNIKVHSGDVVIRVSAVDAPKGVAYIGGDLQLGEAQIDALSVDWETSGSREPSTPAKRGTGESDDVPKGKEPSALDKLAATDLDWLDFLDGRLHIDLTADAKLPFLKSRRATHEFRIAIKNGTLDYKKLEDDLCALEDAVLDFRVIKNELCLVKDIPLIPFDDTTLVAWPLPDQHERTLAKNKLVRLTRLTRPTFPPPDPKAAKRSKESPSFALVELVFGGLEAQLGLRGGWRMKGADWQVAGGDDKRAALERLTLKGGITYRPAPAKPAPGNLEIGLSELVLSFDKLPMAKKRLTGKLSMGGAETKLDFVGMGPSRARVQLKDVGLAAVHWG